MFNKFKMNEKNITFQCMHIAYQCLTSVTGECKLTLDHRKCIIIAGPNINVLKLLILSFVFIQIYIDTGFDGKLALT